MYSIVAPSRPEYLSGRTAAQLNKQQDICDQPTWGLKTFRYLHKIVGVTPQKRRIRLSFRRTFTPLLCILACAVTVSTDLLVLFYNERHNNSTRWLIFSLTLHSVLLVMAFGLGLTTSANRATYVGLTVALAGLSAVWDALSAYVCSSIVKEVFGRIVRLQEFAGRYFIIQVLSAATKIVAALFLIFYVGVATVDTIMFRLSRPVKMRPFPEMAIRHPERPLSRWKGWRDSDSEPESFFSASEEGIPLADDAKHYKRSFALAQAARRRKVTFEVDKPGPRGRKARANAAAGPQ